ncbi:MAG: polymer-forming cytoskeletal protein [Mameliella sp.]|nr:polymer-forming cytoskeletal protein [Mameliella sp.]
MSQTTSANKARSHLAAGAKLVGDLTIPGHFELVGHADGRIRADGITIEAGGSAVGELRADRIVVTGKFEGQILGGDVKLSAGAQVSGEISYTTLTIESGANVNCSFSRVGPQG